jgi:hypothetical protein
VLIPEEKEFMSEEKRIRLGQASRKLNVGHSAIIEFLKKKGIEIESNPNALLTAEQYAMLAKEYVSYLEEEKAQVRLGVVSDNLGANRRAIVGFLAKKGFLIENNPNVKLTREQYSILEKELKAYPSSEKQTSVNEKVNELSDIIGHSGLEKGTILIEFNDNVIEIKDKTDRNRFHIMVQGRDVFYTIRRNSYSRIEEALSIEVPSWLEVLGDFAAWIKIIQRERSSNRQVATPQTATTKTATTTTTRPPSSSATADPEPSPVDDNIVMNALSTSINDSEYNGFAMLGVLGYILEEGIADSVPLTRFDLTYSQNKRDYFYTTNENLERFNGLNPVRKGHLGYVFETQQDGTIRMHRYWNKKQRAHLFVTELVASYAPPEGYESETDRHPIFIYKDARPGTVPVYLFSTKSDFGFVRHPDPAPSILSDQAPEERLLADLQKQLANTNFDLSDFELRVEGDGQVAVLIASDNRSYFRIKVKTRAGFDVHQTSQGQPEKITQLEQWPEVVSKFLDWLLLAGGQLVLEKVFAVGKDNKRNVVLSDGPTTYKFRNDDVKGVLDVQAQANIFFKLLTSISILERGTLLGIFGRWGRGKTFFWNELKKVFGEAEAREDEKTKFTAVEFHAWKYQDTPASWAYLYEAFVKAFYREPVYVYYWNYRLFRIDEPLWLLSAINRFRLNRRRLGSFTFLVGLLTVAFGFVWYFIIGFEEKFELFKDILKTVGASFVASVILFLYFYSGTAKDLFRKYFSRKTFVDLLGIQAEIQKEFIVLFHVWVPDYLLGKKRLALFVDDIDRCSEDRIIQVVDSLKVMMDDPSISNRVLVIAAIDENVLKRAIKLKYHKMVTEDLSLRQEQHSNVQEKLCREYMDKLFLNGFKLGDLNLQDRVAILEALSDGQVSYDSPARTSSMAAPTASEKTDAAVAAEDKANSADENVGDNVSAPMQDSPQAQLPSAEPEELVIAPHNEEKEIMGHEMDRLKIALGDFHEATPRSIRIFYYRYLLAKYFKQYLIKEGSPIAREWLLLSNEEKAILPHLIIRYGNSSNQIQLKDDILKATNSQEETLEIPSLKTKVKLSRELHLALLRIVEIVVPY